MRLEWDERERHQDGAEAPKAGCMRPAYAGGLWRFEVRPNFLGQQAPGAEREALRHILDHHLSPKRKKRLRVISLIFALVQIKPWPGRDLGPVAASRSRWLSSPLAASQVRRHACGRATGAAASEDT